MDSLIVVGIRRACVLDPRSMQLSACQMCWRRKRSRQNDIDSRSKASTVSFILCNAFIVLLQCINILVLVSMTGYCLSQVKQLPKWQLLAIDVIVTERFESVDKWLPPLALSLFILLLICMHFQSKLYFQHPTSFEQCSIFAATALSFWFEGFGWMHGTTGCIQCFLRASAPSCFMAKAQDLEHCG